MEQRWLTWVVALLLIAGVTTVAVVFLLQGDGPPDYVTSFGEKGTAEVQFMDPAGVSVDSSGNPFVLDTGNSRVQRLTPEGTALDIWPAAPGSDKGQFSAPLRLRFNPDGILVIADTDNHRLQTFDTKGQFIKEIGSLGQEPGQFSHPIGLAFDQAGNLWVADSGNHRIQKFGPGLKNVLAIIPETPKESSLKGEFNSPWGVACDATGTVYVADTKNHRVQRFAKDGTLITTWGGIGTKPGQFNFPTDLIIDRSGNLFVVDSGNNRVQKFDGRGGFLCEWGKAGRLAREFNKPQQICEAPDGTIYIADTGNHRIQKYRPRRSPLFQGQESVNMPTKPRVPGPQETPLDEPQVPDDSPSGSGTPRAATSPVSTGTPAPSAPTPVAEPTRF